LVVNPLDIDDFVVETDNRLYSLDLWDLIRGGMGLGNDGIDEKIIISGRTENRIVDIL